MIDREKIDEMLSRITDDIRNPLAEILSVLVSHDAQFTELSQLKSRLTDLENVISGLRNAEQTAAAAAL